MPSTSSQGTTASNIFSAGTTIETLIMVEAWFNNGGGIWYQVPYSHQTNPANIFVISNDSSSNPNCIQLMQSNIAWNGNVGYITIYYTKP